MHYEILDASRRNILLHLAFLKGEGFYLAGGTALALILGHRDSVDFDFFCPQNFDTKVQFEKIQQSLASHSLTIIAEEKNTLTFLINNSIKISLFAYSYPLLNPLLEEEHLAIASLDDIACMKLSAIVSRATMKDYVDIYFILKKITLAELLEKIKKKMPELDITLVLKSLVYFEDVLEEPLLFQGTNKVSFTEVKKQLKKEVSAKSPL
ncbi:MAG: nucleotidyl transferase AbiEii/AbiGii toxin family protein [bacterium]|nr:nucleotidyl transferase AbiEii/AbiGii toxin family protein [bacterium]